MPDTTNLLVDLDFGTITESPHEYVLYRVSAGDIDAAKAAILYAWSEYDKTGRAGFIEDEFAKALAAARIPFTQEPVEPVRIDTAGD